MRAEAVIGREMCEPTGMVIAGLEIPVQLVSLVEARIPARLDHNREQVQIAPPVRPPYLVCRA